jgi:hypothetical protein
MKTTLNLRMSHASFCVDDYSGKSSFGFRDRDRSDRFGPPRDRDRFERNGDRFVTSVICFVHLSLTCVSFEDAFA